MLVCQRMSTARRIAAFARRDLVRGEAHAIALGQQLGQLHLAILRALAPHSVG